MTEHFAKSRPFRLSVEVKAALNVKAPVVALESTVIAHGLPAPHNIETARRLEEIVRRAGAAPATIAILRGEIHVGLDEQQLNHIATARDIHKISTRDLPVAAARAWDGATTVASTAWIAHRAGIAVFATGGIGGIHRRGADDSDNNSSWDVSADLPALAQTPLVVVCSGAKIVLDLAATREWLETYGVTVVGYGCDEMPAFYSRTSGLAIDVRTENAVEVAHLARARDDLGTPQALLVTVPVPPEAEIPAPVLQEALDAALVAASDNKIGGRALTPFLLARMAAQSAGATLAANIALLENNARVAAEIACALAHAGRRIENED